MPADNLTTLANTLAQIATDIIQSTAPDTAPADVLTAAVDRATRRLEANGQAGVAGCFGHFRSTAQRLLSEGF